MSKIRTDPTEHEAQLHRRTFISAGLVGGVALALSPSAQAITPDAFDANSSSLTPGPADSISLYILLLDRLRSQLLRPYFDIVGCLSAEVKSRYEQLRQDVEELERLAPQLRTQQSSNLKGVTDVGHASASLLGSMANEKIVPASSLFAMISLRTETLDAFSNELEAQTGSITLSRKAVALLRKILQEVKDLQKPTEDLNTTSGLLTELNNSLEGAVNTPRSPDKPATIGEVRFELIAAMNDLIVDQLAGQSTPARTASAKAHVDKAITLLTTWDAYKPPDSLQAYITGSQITRCKPSSGTMAGEPTKGLRDLLAATGAWIDHGGQITQTGRSQELKFINASFPAPAPFALKGNCQSVLGEFLPPATGLRTYILMGLVGPIVWFYNAQKSADLIYDQIPNLWPGGAFDNDASRRRAAARRLAGL